jgi:hypothetical protein
MFVVEWRENKKPVFAYFDSLAGAQQFCDDLYGECLIVADVYLQSKN